MVVDEEKDCPTQSTSAMYRAVGSGKNPPNRPKSMANGKDFPAVAPRNGKLIPSVSFEDGDTDSASSSVKDESPYIIGPSTLSVQVELSGLSNRFDLQQDSKRSDADGDETNDVRFAESAEHRNGGVETAENGGERDADVYGHLAEQIQRSEEHVPLHKLVCCSLCRKKEQRLRKRMQEQRSFSCPASSEYLTTGEYIGDETPTFARILDADRNPMLLLRPPDSEAGEFQGRDDEPTSCSPIFESLKSGDGLYDAIQEMSLNDDGPSEENCRRQCTDDMSVRIEDVNDSTANSPSAVDDDPKKFSLDDVGSQANEKSRSANGEERSSQRRFQQNGSDKLPPGFKRRLSLRRSNSSNSSTTNSSTSSTSNISNGSTGNGSTSKTSTTNSSITNSRTSNSSTSNGSTSNSSTSQRSTSNGSTSDSGAVGSDNCADEKSYSTRRFDSLRLSRDPTSDLQPIADPLLLQKLRDTTGLQASELKLSLKDQKMLSVLLARKEQELQRKLRRESSYLQRTEEKRNSTTASSSCSSSSSTSSSKLRRQFSLNEGRGRESHFDSKQALQLSRSLDYHCQEGPCKERQTGGGQCNDPDYEHDCCSRHSKSTGSPSSDKDRVLSRQNSRDQCCRGDDGEHSCCARYSASLLTSPTGRNQNSKKQLQQALERKKQVEQHLKEQKQKTEKYLEQLKEKKEQEQQRAQATRQEKARRLSERSRMHNLQATQKLKEVKESKKMTMEELQAIHEEKRAQLTAAELKVRQLRDSEKAKIESEIRRKLERSQEKQQQLEEELKRWQTELLEYRQIQETNAQSLAQATLARKREALAREREAKERQQKENLTRMLERESEWRAGLEASIQSKDARSKMIQEEKEQMIKRSREAALTSRRLRQELHLNLSLTDLDLLLTRPD